MSYPSAFVIVIINAIPLALAATGRWGTFDVLAAYWWVGLWFALATIAKVIIVRQSATPTVKDEFDVFDIPAGVYVPVVFLASAVSLWGFWAIADPGTAFFSWPNGSLAQHILAELFADGVVWFALLEGVRVVYSLTTNFIQNREYLRARMVFERGLMRIVTLELLAGVLVATSVSTTWWPLWLATAGIGLTDLIAHLIERAQGSTPGHPSTIDYGRGG